MSNSKIMRTCCDLCGAQKMFLQQTEQGHEVCELCGWVQNEHYFRYPNEDILNRPYTSLNYFRFLHILKQFAESIGSSAYNRFKAPKAIYDVWIRKHPELNGQYNMSEFKLTKPDKDLFLSKEDCWDEDDEEEG